MKKIIALLVAVTMAVGVFAQSMRTVTGTVVFAGDGEPLPGASVIAFDAHTGVVTDIDGKFTLSVPAKTSTLRVSYVGMVTRDVEITPGDMVIKLSSADNNLNEVVVTALGMKRERKGLGYAVQDSAPRTSTPTAPLAGERHAGQAHGRRHPSVVGRSRRFGADCDTRRALV